MTKMKELYEKVAADSALQEKFAEIMRNAEADGEEATKGKLTAFAKETGYDVTMEEMQKYFKGLAESKEGELTNAELDQVAGGKSGQGIGNIVNSVLGVGIGCAIMSLSAEMAIDGGCNKIFQ